MEGRNFNIGEGKRGWLCMILVYYRVFQTNFQGMILGRRVGLGLDNV
jgi:hypothetical protein